MCNWGKRLPYRAILIFNNSYIDISRKIWYDRDQLKKVIIISVNGSFFTHFLKIHMKIVRVVTRQYNHRKPLK